MLKQMAMRMQGGSMPEQEQKRIEKLVSDFEEILEKETAELPPKIVRSKLPGSVYVIKDTEKVTICYAPKSGNEVVFNNQNTTLAPDQLVRELSLFKDTDDVAIALIPIAAINSDEKTATAIIRSAVQNHVRQQIEVFKMNERISAFSPIFGPNSYPVQNDLVFVLMPFEEELTRIYGDVVKEAVEDDCGLVCRRADDIKSINPVMIDIWKSICEARLVIADLTGFNANVMYELGIAHTVGKPTLILYQDVDTEKRFPFDLAHIRRINYSNTASGGKKLRAEVADTIKAMLENR